MIKSKTKYHAAKEDVVRIFEANHMPHIRTVEALGNGEILQMYFTDWDLSRYSELELQG